MNGEGPARGPKPSGAVVVPQQTWTRASARCMTLRSVFPSRRERRAVNIPASGSVLVSANVAANALHDYFLANADRGANAANDELVEALVHRIRAERIASADGH
jgi:hypothetical protein